MIHASHEKDTKKRKKGEGESEGQRPSEAGNKKATKNQDQETSLFPVLF
jgi:hypothetical protein